MSWTTPRTWVAGETMTAALLNAHLRDNLDSLATWTSYTPSWTGSGGNPAIGNGSLAGRYIRAGSSYWVEVLMTMGSTTTYGSGVWQWSLPANPASSIRLAIGLATLFDTSGGAGRTWGAYWNTSAVAIMNDAGSHVTPTTPWTWANGDTLSLSLHYRAA